MEAWILEWDARYREWTKSREVYKEDFTKEDSDVFTMIFMMMWNPSDYSQSMLGGIAEEGKQLVGLKSNPLLKTDVKTQYYMRAWAIDYYCNGEQSLRDKLEDAHFYMRGDEDWILRCFRYYKDRASLDVRNLEQIEEITSKLHICDLKQAVELSASVPADKALLDELKISSDPEVLQKYERNITCKTPHMWYRLVRSSEYTADFLKSFSEDQRDAYITEAVEIARKIPKYASLFKRLTSFQRQQVQEAIKAPSVTETLNTLDRNIKRREEKIEDLAKQAETAPEAEQDQIKIQMAAEKVAAAESRLQEQQILATQADINETKETKKDRKLSNKNKRGALGVILNTRARFKIPDPETLVKEESTDATLLRRKLDQLYLQSKTGDKVNEALFDDYKENLPKLEIKHFDKDGKITRIETLDKSAYQVLVDFARRQKGNYCQDLKSLNKSVRHDDSISEDDKERMKAAYDEVHRLQDYLMLARDPVCVAKRFASDNERNPNPYDISNPTQKKINLELDERKRIAYQNKLKGIPQFAGSKKRRANTFKNIKRLPRNGQATTHQRHKRLGSTRRRNRRLKARSQSPAQSKKRAHQTTRRRHERAKPGRNRSLRR
jgi:hypothetical protein